MFEPTRVGRRKNMYLSRFNRQNIKYEIQNNLSYILTVEMGKCGIGEEKEIVKILFNVWKKISSGRNGFFSKLKGYIRVIALDKEFQETGEILPLIKFCFVFKKKYSDPRKIKFELLKIKLSFQRAFGMIVEQMYRDFSISIIEALDEIDELFVVIEDIDKNKLDFNPRNKWVTSGGSLRIIKEKR